MELGCLGRLDPDASCDWACALEPLSGRSLSLLLYRQISKFPVPDSFESGPRVAPPCCAFYECLVVTVFHEYSELSRERPINLFTASLNSWLSYLSNLSPRAELGSDCIRGVRTPSRSGFRLQSTELRWE